MVHYSRISFGAFGARFSNRTTAVTALVAATVLLSGAQISHAAAEFDFEFESFAVAGSVTFNDDFEDGLRDSGPTSLLVDSADGTTTVEAGGGLVLSDADGSAETIDGETVLRMDTVVLQSLPILNSGSGTTTLTGTLSGSFVLPTPFDTTQFSGVQLGSTSDSDRTVVGVELVGAGVSVALIEVVGGIRTILGSDPIARGDVSENFVLEISLDQSLDSASVRYSLDGGSNFIEQGSWDSPPVAGTFDYDQNLFAQLSAFAETVPEPSAWLLSVTNLTVLALLARVRNGAPQRHRQLATQLFR